MSELGSEVHVGTGTPVDTVRRFQARALAAMFGAGAVLGLVSAVIPHGPGVNSAAWAINSSIGIPVAVALYIAGARTPAWVLHLLLITGAAMVALGLVFGGGGQASVATSFFFVWVALYVSWFFSVRATAVHLTLDSVFFATMLVVEEVTAGPAIWLLVMGTAVVVAVVVALMHRELVRAATLDSLTGLPTRQTLDDAFAREIARAQRSAAPLCVAIIDVDDLKSVNDRHGHQAGDRLLSEAALGWRAALRDSDILVRFGGDEFVAVLPNCNRQVAREVLQRLREATPIGCSMGLAWWHDGEQATDVLARADAELYLAKRAGRPQPITPAAVGVE